MRRVLLFSILLYLSIGSITSLSAQTKVTVKSKTVTDSTAHRSQPLPELIIAFPNINKFPFYEDRKKLKIINRYERHREYDKALPLLRDYVGKFGIQNFYRNTSLLWRLAQLYERANDLENAKAYYRLALKHTRSDIRKIKLYYDSLEASSKSFYVPLKFYYELVEYRKSIRTFHPPKGVYTNMGSDINSKHEDYGPAMNGNTDHLIFTSRRNLPV